MELYIGGRGQGKFDYARELHPDERWNVLDGETVSLDLTFGKMPGERAVIDHLHLWVKRCLQQGAEPEDALEGFLEWEPDCILICGEVGNGIVPMDPLERAYRERVGRIQIRLAARADRVERVFCGIGQRLK
ncbi:MAG TPA: bifunctional adenosylcobinamide kinase/adenosylcobinamide-phosphate guanylyltransferase [Candidatus Ventrimonas merdavium]|nr:bifunctional adenosylcobinamide kinase/adenosylcobinamide-phosphate guanylyltransferase [Candidatus Ventrimonas merdavium]